MFLKIPAALALGRSRILTDRCTGLTDRCKGNGVSWVLPAMGNLLSVFRGGLCLLASVLLSACAWLQPDPAALPRAELLGIRELGRDGGETRHQVTLRLSNPSDRELRVSGLSCYVHVDGVLAAEGHTGPLMPLPPASATRILIETRANVLGGLKLMTGMSERTSRQYRLDVRLRRPWRWWPLEIKAAGEVTLDR